MLKQTLIILLSFIASNLWAQTGDITRNPFKERKLKEAEIIKKAMESFQGALVDSIAFMHFLSETKTAFEKSSDDESTLLSIPAGATAGTATKDLDDVHGGAQVGVQIGKLGVFHLKVLFNFADRIELKEGNSINSFFINPTTSPLSLFGDFVIWPVKIPKKKDWLRLGPFVRGGIALASFKAADSLVEKNGDIYHGSIGLSIISGPQKVKIGEAENVFQLGLEVAYTKRSIKSDIAFKSNDKLRMQVLGFIDRSFGSLEWTFFVRLNNIRPYVKVTNFEFNDAQSNVIEIEGLSGTQAFIGVEVLSSFFDATLGKKN